MEQREGRDSGKQSARFRPSECNSCLPARSVWRNVFWVLCVLIGKLPDPGVSTPAPLSVAAVGVSFPKIQNEPRGCGSVSV